MSLILDALNKSRSDTGEVPGLGAEHYREEPPRPWLRYLPWAGLAVAVLLIIGLLLAREDAPEESIVAPVAELSRNLGSAATSVTEELKARAEEGRQKRAAQAPVETANPQPAQQSGVPAATEAPVAEPVAPARSLAPQGQTAATPAQAAEEAAAVQALYEKRRRAGQALLERAAKAKAAEAAAASVEQEEPIDVERVLRQAQEEVANAGLVEHPAPFLVSLSQQTKNAIPTILYQRHDYNTQPGRSSVTLNGQTVRVGGSPAAGLKVDEILEDSVILDYRGTQFRLRALNSWVNL